MISFNKEKATFWFLCLLPFLAFLSLGFYSYPILSRAVLLIESGAFFLLLLINLETVGRWYRWGILFINAVSVALTLFFYSGIGVALSFFNLLISLLLFNNIALTAEKKRTLHFLTAALLLLFYGISNFGRLYTEITMLDFSGYKLNQNVVGMLLLALFYHAFNYVSLLNAEENKKRGILIATTLICGYVICLSFCRSAIISLAVFIGLLSFCRIYKGDIPYFHYKTASVVILVLSLAFTLVYVYLSYKISDLKILGKDLFSGREIIWQSAYGLISESPIIGHGTDVLLNTVDGAKTTSAHNMLLSFLYTLGAVPTITIISLFVNRNGRGDEYKRHRITEMSLIASLFVCFFESFFADPTLQIFFSLLLLSNVKIDDKKGIV